MMLVQALDPRVQTDVRLELIAPGAVVEISRLPCENQRAASVVVRVRFPGWTAASEPEEAPGQGGAVDGPDNP